MAPNASSIEPPLRALLFLSVIWLLGLSAGLDYVIRPVVGASLFARLEKEVRDRQLLAVGMLALSSIALLVVQLLPLEVNWADLDEWRALFMTAAFGQMALARVVLSLLALVCVLRLRERARTFVVALIALLVAASITRTGHSVAMESGLQSVIASFAHLVSGALWAGGLTVLVLASDAIVEKGEQAPALIHALICRFSPFGVAAVALASGAGILLSGVHIESLDAFRTSYFGRVLAAKIVVVLLAVALAAWHRLSSRRGMHTQAHVETFRKTLWIELLLVHVVFYGAALMTTASTPGMAHGNEATSAFFAGLSIKRWTEILAIGIALAAMAAAFGDRRSRSSITT